MYDADELTEETQPDFTIPKFRFPTCGHSQYEHKTEDMLKVCRCTACGHQWVIALEEGDAGAQ